MQAKPTGNNRRVSLVVTQEELAILRDGLGEILDYLASADNIFDKTDPKQIERMQDVLDSVRE